MRGSLLIVFLLGVTSLMGQNKLPVKRFRLPATVSSADYTPGFVRVKIKSSYKSKFQSSASGRVATANLPGVIAMKPIASSASTQAVISARSGPLKSQSNVDISLYYQIQFDGSQSVEDFINQLYAKDYFEIIEPQYKEHLLYTPNDPSITSQYYLGTIKAYDAWDLTKGSSDIVIGVVDTGGDLDHPDLVDKLYYNEADPIDGTDNDNDGYVDNYRGWDFIGSDTLNLFKSDYPGDNDPSINPTVSSEKLLHGAWVAGCAAAKTDNGTGIAGVGFNTKLLFVKLTADNDPNAGLYKSSDGIYYAATHGAKIINCSFGGTTRSQIDQDIINYVTLDLNCLVIAAAGNENTSAASYPAAYDHVLSVAATTSADKRASFTNYGNTVDISAPGVGIYTTAYNNSYGSVDGTSFSSPITCGAASLVWAAHPEFTALQVAEQLRVTADPAFYTSNTAYKNKLGKGRLDVYRALTIESPALRASNAKLVTSNGTIPAPGESALLYFDFTNYLKATSSGLTISISSTSSRVTITKNSITPGIITEGSTFSNSTDPFEVTVSSSTPTNTQVDFLITYADGTYSDYQFVSFVLNPTYLNIDKNKIITTISATGRLGYEDTQNQAKGSGFIFNESSILYEMGVITGTSSSTILNNVRGINNGFDADFVSLSQIKEINPGERSLSEIFGSYSNSTTTANQTAIITYRSLVWKDAPYDKFVIIEYKIKNPQATAITNYNFGMFADWDISTSGQKDAAAWNDENKIGYVYPKVSTELPHAGIQVLSGNPQYYAIDNDGTIAGNPFGLYDGFTDAEKYTTISSGLTGKLVAGASTTNGNDVSHVVSSGPYTIQPGEEITIAFALHAAINLDELLTSAKYADSIYNYTLKAATPVVSDTKVCYKGDAVVDASGASKIKWYTDFTGGEAFFTGNEYTLPSVLSDTTFYISNADNSYESLRVPANIIVKANPTIIASGSSTFCEGQSIQLSVAEADAYLWSTGEKTQSIQVSTKGDFSVTVTDATLGCESTSETFSTLVNVNPVASFTLSGNAETGSAIVFSNASSGAASWLWNFGDGQTSTDENPSHTFSDNGSFTVLLTATSDLGCQATATKDLSVITGLEQWLSNQDLHVYPNPAREKVKVEVTLTEAGVPEVSLMNAQGKPLFKKQYSLTQNLFSEEISISNLSQGLYIVKVTIG
ncbi:MAG TPA: S8 family serine peptidase, partial [Cyclobacteriaceae bacterium]